MLSWPSSACSCCLGLADTTAGGVVASAMPENFSVCRRARGGRWGHGAALGVSWGDEGCGAAPYLGDEPPAGLVALPVCGTLLLLLQDALPARAVLQGELPQQLADGHHLHVPHGAGRVPQVQQEGVKPAGTPVTVGSSPLRMDHGAGGLPAGRCPPVEDAPVDHLQDDDALGAVLEEVRQLALQHRLGLVLGDHLQVVPGGPAAPLQLHQAVGQLIKIDLEEGDVSPRGGGGGGGGVGSGLGLTLAERVMEAISE